MQHAQNYHQFSLAIAFSVWGLYSISTAPLKFYFQVFLDSVRKYGFVLVIIFHLKQWKHWAHNRPEELGRITIVVHSDVHHLLFDNLGGSNLQSQSNLYQVSCFLLTPPHCIILTYANVRDCRGKRHATTINAGIVNCHQGLVAKKLAVVPDHDHYKNGQVLGGTAKFIVEGC